MVVMLLIAIKRRVEFRGEIWRLQFSSLNSEDNVHTVIRYLCCSIKLIIIPFRFKYFIYLISLYRQNGVESFL